MTTSPDAFSGGIALIFGGVTFLTVAGALGSSGLINLQFWGIVYVIGGIVVALLAVIAAIMSLLGEL